MGSSQCTTQRPTLPAAASLPNRPNLIRSEVLAHFGETAAAEAVERTIAEVLAEGGVRMPDLGGNAGTKELGAAIH